MSREILVVWAGRHRRQAWEELCGDYRKRLGRYLSVRDVPVKVKVKGEGETRRRAEGRALLAALPGDCWPVALDLGGKSMDSVELARRLGRLREEWPHSIAFLIGSDLGLDPEVLKRARWRLSLGPLTFGHELARLLLYEQLYRSISIDRGIKYHRGAV